MSKAPLLIAAAALVANFVLLGAATRPDDAVASASVIAPQPVTVAPVDARWGAYFQSGGDASMAGQRPYNLTDW